MNLKKLLIIPLIFFFLPILGQDSTESQRERKHKIQLGMGLNFPMATSSTTHKMGIGFNQQYEYLLWGHFSVVQSLAFNYVTGRSVREFYHGEYVDTQYHNLNLLPIQIGVCLYFGDDHQKFFLQFMGGAAYYWGTNPGYPEIRANGNLVQAEILPSDYNGVFGMFTPSIGWQINKIQLSTSYQGTVLTDVNLNVWNVSLAYRVF